MVFEVIPFVVCAGGSAALGTGAWWAAMGTHNEAWASCLGRGKRGPYIAEQNRPIVDKPVERAHTGLSPRLSHIVDTMRGENQGSTRDHRPPEQRHNYSLIERERRPPPPPDERTASLAHGLENAFRLDKYVLRSVPKKEAEAGETKERAVYVSKVSGQVFQGLNANLPPPIFIPSKRAMSGPVLTRLDPAPIHVRGSEDFAPVNYAQQVLATKVEEQRQEYRSRPQPKQLHANEELHSHVGYAHPELAGKRSSPPPPPPTGRDFNLAGGLENAFKSRDASPAAERRGSPPPTAQSSGGAGVRYSALIPSDQYVASASTSTSTFASAPGAEAHKVQRKDPLIPPMPPAADYEREQVAFLEQVSNRIRGSAGAPAAGPGLESAPPTERNDDNPPYILKDRGNESHKAPFVGARAENENAPMHVSALLGGKARIPEPTGMGQGVLGPGQVDSWLERRKTSGSGIDADRGGGGHQPEMQGGGRGGAGGGGGAGAKGMPAGIGISLSPLQSGGMLVANLVPGGPAALTGKVHMGDELKAVDGRLIAGSNIPDVIRLILGPSGTQVTLRVWNEVEGERNVVVTRKAAPPNAGKSARPASMQTAHGGGGGGSPGHEEQQRPASQPIVYAPSQQDLWQNSRGRRDATDRLSDKGSLPPSPSLSRQSSTGSFATVGESWRETGVSSGPVLVGGDDGDDSIRRRRRSGVSGNRRRSGAQSGQSTPNSARMRAEQMM